MEGPGKFLMKHIWRFQQIGGLVSVILMCLNLTIPLYEFSGWRIVELGVPANLDWLIVIILFSIIFGIALLTGYAYDKVFKLWSPQKVVGIERDPYAKGRLTPQEYLRYQYIFIPLLIKNGLRAEAEFNLKWNKRIYEQDPEFRDQVLNIKKYVDQYKLKNIEDRWLQDMNKIIGEQYKVKDKKVRADW